MIAFEVKVNGIVIGTAGAEDLSVLSVIVDAIGKVGPKAQLKGHANPDELDLHLNACGLTSRSDSSTDEHMNWIEFHKLKVGDVVEVRILDLAEVGPPISKSLAERKAS